MMSQFAQDIIARGRPEWEMKGRQEEAAAMLTRQLRHRFEKIPDWAAIKVNSANLEIIEMWSENFVFAKSLEDVFTS